MKLITHICGVDEAGRGPLAGPVSVGVVMVQKSFDWKLFEDVRDSKKLSSKKREIIFERAQELQKNGLLTYRVSMVSAAVIDRIGITQSVAAAIGRAMKHLSPDPEKTSIKLDGLLKAPSEFLFQETIIKGDDIEQVISLASIMAKVTRDRYMKTAAKKYPKYHLEMHKGYGTEFHRKAIKKHGISKIHRVSYCRNI